MIKGYLRRKTVTGITDIEGLYDSAADKYDDMYSDAKHKKIVAAENKFLKDIIHTKNFGSVLDAGVGTGLFLDIFNEQVPCSNYLGLDISQEMLNNAEEKHPSYLFRHIDFMEYPVIYKFDTVISYFAIADYCGLAGVKKLTEHLNDDGMLVCTFINSKGGYDPHFHNEVGADIPVNKYCFSDLDIFLKGLNFKWYYVLGFSNVVYNDKNSTEDIYQSMMMHKHNLNNPKYFYLMAQV